MLSKNIKGVFAYILLNGFSEVNITLRDMFTSSIDVFPRLKKKHWLHDTFQ